MADWRRIKIVNAKGIWWLYSRPMGRLFEKAVIFFSPVSNFCSTAALPMARRGYRQAERPEAAKFILSVLLERFALAFLKGFQRCITDQTWWLFWEIMDFFKLWSESDQPGKLEDCYGTSRIMTVMYFQKVSRQCFYQGRWWKYRYTVRNSLT